MFKDVVQAMDTGLLAFIGLFTFIVAFGLILARAFLLSRKERTEAKNIPFDDPTEVNPNQL